VAARSHVSQPNMLTPESSSHLRRGGSLGEPAAHPVPPLPNAPDLSDNREASRTHLSEGIRREGTSGDGQSPFRVGTGGLVVVIVPEQLKVACARRGWSLTDLAKRAGISYPTLRSILRGRAIRPRTAWKLARALGEGNAPIEFDHLLQPT
jgi:lambda repressor-like predicted transcriptional regulator